MAVPKKIGNFAGDVNHGTEDELGSGVSKMKQKMMPRPGRESELMSLDQHSLSLIEPDQVNYPVGVQQGW